VFPMEALMFPMAVFAYLFQGILGGTIGWFW
jgi:hypothetical protein